eukprot:SAG11_NODE_35040_length_268_cov_2.455621_1_plen_25_part_10
MHASAAGTYWTAVLISNMSLQSVLY